VSRRLESALYEGWVRHRRRGPRAHAFRYRLFLTYLDLGELDEAFRGRWLWSTRRPAPVWYRRGDFLGPADVPLEQAVRDRVESALGRRPRGAIRMLAQLRTWGYAFNPVSFYYCFDAAEPARLDAVVAEITNTPWGERHAYVVGRAPGDGSPTLRARFAKESHVSPFSPLDHAYDWRFTTPADRLAVHMVNRRAGARVFDATLCLARRPLTGGALARYLVRYPAQTLKVHAPIYWQALRLWLKRTPAFAHPKHACPQPQQETA